MKKTLLIAIAITALITIYFYYTSQNTHLRTGIDNNAPQPDTVVTDNLMSSAAENAMVFIMAPGDGTSTTSPVTVSFGISGMTVSPAGIDAKNSGHHHLLIDADVLPPLDQPLPGSDKLIHFGGGQTETTIELSPGTHTLQLVLGNYLHIPHNPPVVSKKISITVTN